jgi:hypothetical protein
MPVAERVVILALCAIALVFIVVWVVRSLRRGEIDPGGETPQVRGVGRDRLNVAYFQPGSVGDDLAPAEHPRRPRDR